MGHYIRNERGRLSRRAGTLASLALGLLLATTGCADSDEPMSPTEQPFLREGPYSERTLKHELRDIKASAEAVGALAEVGDSGRLVRARVGSSQLGVRETQAFDSQFRIGSVSKTFTAVVVLQLVSEGKLSLDDSVERHLPGVVTGNGNDGSQITLRQLLQHTSGLFDYAQEPSLVAWLSSREAFEAHRFSRLSHGEQLALALRQAPLFTPGARFLYSNTNYVVLGMIIEAVTASSWHEQVTQRIVAPLALSRTAVPGFTSSLVAPHVHGYTRFAADDDLVDVTETSLISGADAGVVSTLGDLRRFFEALLRGELLDATQLAQMKATVLADDAPFPGDRYGLGLSWSPLPCGGSYFHHDGDTLGFSTVTGAREDGSRSVVAVVNGAANAEAAAREMRTLVEHALCAE